MTDRQGRGEERVRKSQPLRDKLRGRGKWKK